MLMLLLSAECVEKYEKLLFFREVDLLLKDKQSNLQRPVVVMVVASISFALGLE